MFMYINYSRQTAYFPQMNPSAAKIWNIPPPPGTEEEELSNCSSKRDGSMYSGTGRAIDRIDPYIKAPEYIEFERKCSSDVRSKYRSRSRSRSRGKHHRRRHSRSKSRERHRRSRSRSRRRHRRRHSSSRSSSRSPSYRHSRRRHGRRRRSSSRSRSNSRTRRSRGSRSKRDRKSATPRKIEEQPPLDADTNEVDMKIEEEEEEEDDAMKDNVFKNDGSFLEMFKKMQEQQQQKAKQEEEAAKPLVPAFGKRRGGKVLKTGLVQKVRLANDEESNAQDAWSVYMKEVRRYKEACCDDDSKTRPLVK